MTIPVWPSSLPQKLLREGYGRRFADLRLSSPMDSGPAKIRRRNTAGVQPVKGVIRLTSSQLAVFKSFYEETLLNGTLRFSWNDPDNPETWVDMRFDPKADPPDWSCPRLYYEVSLSLEILP